MRLLLGALFSGSIALSGLGCAGGETAGVGGAGGEGGEGASTNASSASTTNASSASTTNASSASATASSGASGTGGGAPGEGGDHLLISEVGVVPAGGEFVEIYNPTGTAIPLDDYYLSDNSTYYSFAQNQPWNPPTDNEGTDFLAGFPAGTTLEPGEVLVVATSPAFEEVFGKCPDFVLAAGDLACASGKAKAMVAPDKGGIGDKAGALLSNGREMVVLFRLEQGKTELEDVDYLTWGTGFEDATRVDKTGIGNYQPDTPRASQKPAPAPPPVTNVPADIRTIARCDVTEPGEKTSGGNGISGHDETSEDLAESFKLEATPSPGAKNGCL